MNKNLFCILYNQAKGGWVVVRESALGRGAVRYCGCIPMLLGCCGVATVLPPALQAQVVAADPNAPPGCQPTVGAAANQTPLVQIARPNAAGVSNNHYGHFNVGPQGLILNNAREAATTQLGGLVAGNPALAGGGAGIILNQVTGCDRSLLAGMIEVAGQRADVIIANPNGIVCNGGGFINTSRGLLTTGVPLLGPSGGLDGFRVSGGMIEIGPGGLKADQLDRVELIARSLQANGQIRVGGTLNVVTGLNQVAYADLGVKVLPDLEGRPTVGVDVGLLGGMHAHRIHLLGTEAGVGVNSQGTLAAQAGGFTCTQEGRIVLNGRTTSGGNLALETSGAIANGGTVYAQGSATLASRGPMSSTGTLGAQGDLLLRAAELEATGALGAGIDGEGRAVVAGSLNVTAQGTLAATGKNVAGGDLAFTGASLALAKACTEAGGNLSLTATAGDIRSQGRLQAQGSFRADAPAGSLVNDHGRVAARTVHVTGAGLSNRSGLIAQAGAEGNTRLELRGPVDNTAGGITSQGKDLHLRSFSLANERKGEIRHLGPGLLSIRTGRLSNDGGLLSSQGALGIASPMDITNARGTLEADGFLNLVGRTITNDAGLILSRRGFSIVADAQLKNLPGTTAAGTPGGMIGTKGEAALYAGSLDNAGTIEAGPGLRLHARTMENSGTLRAHERLLAEGELLRNAREGKIHAPSLTLKVARVENAHGEVQAGALSVTAADLFNAGGRIIHQGAEPMALEVAGELANTGGGRIESHGADLKLAPRTLDNSGGTIAHVGTGTLSLQIGDGRGALANTAGTIRTEGAMDLGAGSVGNQGGTLEARQELAVTALQGGIDNGAAEGKRTTGTQGGSIEGETVRLQADQGMLRNHGGRITAARAVAIDAQGLGNPGGLIQAPGLDLNVAQLHNGNGEVKANRLALSAGTLTNEGGRLTHLGTAPMTLAVADTLSNTVRGLIQTNSPDLTLAPRTLDNSGGTIVHAGTGTLTLRPRDGRGNLENRAGSIGTLGRLDLAAGSVDNSAGKVIAEGPLSLDAPGAVVANAGGRIAAGRDLEVKAGTVTGRGQLVAGGDSALRMQGDFTHASGNEITAARNLTLETTGTWTNAGSLRAPGTVTVRAAKVRSEATGLIQGRTALLAADQELLLQGRVLGGDVTLESRALLTNSGTVEAKGWATLTSAGAVRNSGSVRARALAVSAATLDNAGGKLIHLGEAPMTLAVTGTLANTGGGLISTAGTSLSITSSTLDNSRGTIVHGGTGVLSLKPGGGKGALANTGGTLATRGHLEAVAGSVDNARGTMRSDADLGVRSGSRLDNAGGLMASAASLEADAKGAIHNTGGRIEGGGTGAWASVLKVTADSIDNREGQILGAGAGGSRITGASRIVNGNSNGTPGMGAILGNGPMTVATPELRNGHGGQMRCNDDLTLEVSGRLDNSGGRIHAQGRLRQQQPGAAVTNAGGRIAAAGDVELSVASLDNTGGELGSSRQGPGNVRLRARGRVANARGTITSAQDLTLDAGALEGGGRLLGGRDAEVSLGGDHTHGAGSTIAAGRDLTLGAAGALTNAGSLTAPRTVTVGGAEVRNQASGFIQGPAVRVNADRKLVSQGRIFGEKVTLESKGRGSIEHSGTAGARQDLVLHAAEINVSGTLGAGLDAKGEAVNPGDLKLTADGRLTATGRNTAGGNIALTGAALALGGARTNAGGNVTLTATGGNIEHAQDAVLQARGTFSAEAPGALVNDQGRITARQVRVKAHSLSNVGGTLAQSGPEEGRIQCAGELDNTAGTIDSRAQDLVLTAASFHNDRKGQVQHAGTGHLSMETGRLGNEGGTLATSGRMTLTAAGIGNQGGTVESLRGMTVTAQSLDNTGGRLVNTGEAALAVTTAGAITNGQGVIGSSGRATLAAAGIDNTRGTLQGGPELDVQSATHLRNAGGVLHADGSLRAGAKGVLTNTAGARIEAGGDGKRDSTLGLAAFILDNAEGRILNAGTGHSVITGTLQITNSRAAKVPRMGVMGGQGKVTVSTRQLRNLDGGQLGAGGDLTLAVTDLLDNTGGQLQAMGRLEVKQPRVAVTNANGRISAAGNVDLALSALDNNRGVIRNAVDDAGDVRIEAAGAVDQSGGQIASGQDLTLTAGSLVGRGTIIGGLDARISLRGDYTHEAGNAASPSAGSPFHARRNLTLATTGALINTGTLEAPGTVTVRANAIDNRPSGLIHGRQAVVATTPGALNNAGRIFGDDIALGAGHYVARKHGSSPRAGVVAARNSLNIGAAVDLGEGALLLSQGNLAIGGELDAKHQATGSAGSVTNNGSTIQSANGDVTIRAISIKNFNFNFTTENYLASKEENISLLKPSNGTKIYRVSELKKLIFKKWIIPPEILQPGESANFDDYTRYDVTRCTHDTRALTTTPGRLLAGGNLRLAADTIVNDKSEVMAGNDLVCTGTKIQNIDAFRNVVVEDKGTSVNRYTEWRGGFDSGRREHWHSNGPYANSQIKHLPMGIYKEQKGVAPQAAGNPAAGQNVGPRPALPGAATVDLAQNAAWILQGSGVRSVDAPIPDLSLPDCLLHRVNAGPGAPCLVETDPTFLDGKPWPGLEHMLERMDLPPGMTLQRMGDGFFETQLVGQQVRRLTGRMFLTQGATGPSQDFVALMDRGLAGAGSLRLKPGVALTGSQQGALAQDSVWPVQQQVARPDGKDVPVLVPVVYLTPATAAKPRPAGAVMSARAIEATLSGTLDNSATLMADDKLRIAAADIRNQGDLRTTGTAGVMALSARRDLASSGTIQGQLVSAAAGRDLTLQSTTLSTSNLSGDWTGIDQTAQVSAATLIAEAGRDLKLGAAQVRTTGDAALSAGRDLTLSAVTTSVSVNVGSGRNYNNLSHTQVAGTRVDTGGNQALQAGRDLTATAAHASADGDFKAGAGRSLTLDSAVQTTHLDEAYFRSSSGLFSSSATESQVMKDSRTAIGTLLSGNTVTLQAVKDLKITGGTVAGTGKVAVTAGGQLHLRPSTSTQSSSSYQHSEESGLMSGGGLGFTIGRREQTDRFDHSAVVQSQNRTIVGSQRDSLSLAARTARVDGSDLLAGGNLEVKAEAITFGTGRDQSRSRESHDFRQTGLTLALGSSVVNQTRAVIAHVQGALDPKGDERARALHGALAAHQARQLDERRSQLRSALASREPRNLAAAAGLQVTVALGTSQSHSESSMQALTHAGSRALAEGDMTLAASAGDLTAEAAAFAAENLTLEAARNLNLRSARDTTSNRSSNSSSSASLGVTFALGADGVAASLGLSAERGHGFANGDSASNQNTTATARKTLAFASGDDANLHGAQARGERIVGKVGGNLDLASQYDTFRHDARQNQAGFALSVPLGPGRASASVSGSQSHARGDYQSVDQQTALSAGSDGFQLEVRQKTRLAGARLDSTAPAPRNILDTGGLEASDLANHASGSASSSGFGISSAALPDGPQAAREAPDPANRPAASASDSRAGSAARDAWPQAAQEAIGLLANRGSAQASDASTARSAIAPATVRIRDGQGAARTVAQLREAFESPNRPLARPDMPGLQARAAARQAVHALAGEAVVAYGPRIQQALSRPANPFPVSRAGEPGPGAQDPHPRDAAAGQAQPGNGAGDAQGNARRAEAPAGRPGQPADPGPRAENPAGMMPGQGQGPDGGAADPEPAGHLQAPVAPPAAAPGPAQGQPAADPEPPANRGASPAGGQDLPRDPSPAPDPGVPLRLQGGAGAPEPAGHPGDSPSNSNSHRSIPLGAAPREQAPTPSNDRPVQGPDRKSAGVASAAPDAPGSAGEAVLARQGHGAGGAQRDLQPVVVPASQHGMPSNPGAQVENQAGMMPMQGQGPDNKAAAPEPAGHPQAPMVPPASAPGPSPGRPAGDPEPAANRGASPAIGQDLPRDPSAAPAPGVPLRPQGGAGAAERIGNSANGSSNVDSALPLAPGSRGQAPAPANDLPVQGPDRGAAGVVAAAPEAPRNAGEAGLARQGHAAGGAQSDLRQVEAPASQHGRAADPGPRVENQTGMMPLPGQGPDSKVAAPAQDASHPAGPMASPAAVPGSVQIPSAGEPKRPENQGELQPGGQMPTLAPAADGPAGRGLSSGPEDKGNSAAGAPNQAADGSERAAPASPAVATPPKAAPKPNRGLRKPTARRARPQNAEPPADAGERPGGGVEVLENKGASLETLSGQSEPRVADSAQSAAVPDSKSRPARFQGPTLDMQRVNLPESEPPKEYHSPVDKGFPTIYPEDPTLVASFNPLAAVKGAGDTVSDWVRNNITDPVERAKNKMRGLGWIEDRDVPAELTRIAAEDPVRANEIIKRIEADNEIAKYAGLMGGAPRVLAAGGVQLAGGGLNLPNSGGAGALAPVATPVVVEAAVDAAAVAVPTAMAMAGKPGSDGDQKPGGKQTDSVNTDHAQQRADEAKAGDTHRQVGDANRTVQDGRKFIDSETGHTVHVRGDKVVIRTTDGKPVTQFKNSRANTQDRIKSGKWVPVSKP